MGAELPAARHSGARYVAAAQAAWQPAAERHKVLLHGGCFGASQRPFLADQGDEHHQPALATAECSKKHRSNSVCVLAKDLVKAISKLDGLGPASFNERVQNRHHRAAHFLVIL